MNSYRRISLASFAIALPLALVACDSDQKIDDNVEMQTVDEDECSRAGPDEPCE